MKKPQYAHAHMAIAAYWDGQLRDKAPQPLYFLVGQEFYDAFLQESLILKAYIHAFGAPDQASFRDGALRCIGQQGWWFKPVSLRTFKAAK